MSDHLEDNPDVAAASGSGVSSVGQEDPVLVYETATNEEAEVVRASLEAAGIPAFLQYASANPVMGAADDRVGDLWQNGVFVAASNVEAARTILNAPSPTEEELAAEEEADPTTLEEAEARVKNA